MNSVSHPTPVWLKWLLRSLGIILILGSLYLTVLVIIALVLAFQVFLGPKGHAVSDQQWMNVFAGLLGRLVGQGLLLLLGIWLVRWPKKKKLETAEISSPVSTPIVIPAAPSSSASTRSKRWSACNILQVAPDANRLWRFGAKGGNFVLDREQKIPGGEPLPSRLVAKSWSSLWQPKLNVAWLPPENVYLRVIELPKSSFEETQAMVELQLEKLSPLPVTQIVWTLHLLPAAASDLQSVVVVIAGRAAVEEFLGKLEKDGYLADRLEAPMLDQLEATPATEDGAWIYAGTRGKDAALVAWRSHGALRNLCLMVLPPEGDRAKSLKDQLAQLCWAGEMEGWLTELPKWHLVADPVNAAEWENLLREVLDDPVRVVEPPPPAELAARTARRAASSSGAALLPAEFSARYHQQFVDRLWLRGLITTGIVYAIGVVIYFCATTVLNYKTTAVEQRAVQLGDSYTNVLQLKARYTVLAVRQQLKYAALDCWKIVAEQLPSGLSLQRSSFTDGQKLTLNGVCSPDQIGQISDQGKFYDAIRKAKLDGQDMFEAAAIEPLIWNGSGTVNWHFTLQLKRTEAAP